MCRVRLATSSERFGRFRWRLPTIWAWLLRPHLGDLACSGDGGLGRTGIGLGRDSLREPSEAAELERSLLAHPRGLAGDGETPSRAGLRRCDGAGP
jgi:hypothetical protein